MSASSAESLSYLTAEERQAIIASFSNEELAGLEYDWKFWGRPKQLLPEGDWLTWLLLAGRGFGKTRAATEAVRALVCGNTPLEAGRHGRIAIIAETAADARDVMVEGEPGILAIHPPAFRPLYESSKRRLTWPNGAVATLYNATEPDQLRGPQHSLAVCDELAKWTLAEQTWDMLQFGMRVGDHPQQIIATTPRGGISVLKRIMAQSTTVITRGATLENRSNLAPSFFTQVVARYEGTRLGRQELNAEILDDVVGALWTRTIIDKAREPRSLPDMRRVVVAIDPSGSDGSDDDADSIGIVVAGLGIDGRGYVLADRTCKLSPAGWGKMAVKAYHEFKADRIVAERNFGGAMVAHVILTTDKNVAFKEVTASRGKIIRAEPIAALYEQGRISHIGDLAQLEDQMCQTATDGYLGEGSPDRLDAMVWGLTDLMLGAEAPVAYTGTFRSM